MNPGPRITLRPAEAADEPLLRAVFADARGAELGGVGLDAGGLELLLDLQRLAQDTGYRQRHPNAEYCVVSVDGIACGRLVLDWKADELRVVDIALLASWRGRGIGGGLLRSLQQGAALAGRRVRLCVALDNPARHLYQRLGFREVASDELNVDMTWEPGAARHSDWHSRDGLHINRGAAA
jgi:ribosomal protein S18 acetylase RimI-like enzyme